MGPPADQGVLEHPRLLHEVALSHDARGPGVSLSVRDVVALVDVWVVLCVLWAARLVTGSLGATEIAFGVVALALIGSPKARPDRLTQSALDDAGAIFTRVALAFAVLSAVSTVAHLDAESRLLFLALPIAPSAVAGRALAYSLGRQICKRRGKARALLVGGGEIGERVADILSTHEEYGLELVGGVTSRSDGYRGTRTLGALSSVGTLVQTHDIDTVIVAFDSYDEAGVDAAVRDALTAGARVWVVPRFHEFAGAGSCGDHLWGLPVTRLLPAAQRRPGWAFKRALDVVFSGLCLVVLAPLYAVVSALIVLDSGRPVFLRQRRVGLDGEPFEILKFRTMRPCDPKVEATEWAADEDRITRVGRFLRNTSLDELPQLWNVFKGEMSLVGPRPERPHFVDLFSKQYPNYGTRHQLPAGVTGWSQIHGLRGDTSIEERALFDNYYVENWSLAQDVKILLRTVTAFRHTPGGSS